MLILYVLLYITGCVLGYVAFKRDTVKKFGKWTKGDRRNGLFLSLLSWATVLTAVIIHGLDPKEGDDKPATW
jgi:hypothetical protein